MRTIMTLNTKGGSGKSTISTNLSACFASRGKKVALMDYDIQRSSMAWLSRRAGKEYMPIQGLDAAGPLPEGVTRSWYLRVEQGTDLLVIDTPAAISTEHLQDYVRRCDGILIPVMPSKIDIHAVAHFIGDLLVAGRVRQLNKPVGIIANRVKMNTRIYRELERFLAKLDIPLITRFRDTQNYVQAADVGCGIHEMVASGIEADIASWSPLIEWVEEIPIAQGDQAAKPLLQNPLRSPGAIRTPKMAY